MNHSKRLTVLFILLATGSGFCATPTPEELEAWFNSPDPDVPSVDHVNEGELHFLTQQPDEPVHFHQNEVWLEASSLSSGWARLRQCHDHLDPVGRLQITFAPERVKDLKIEESQKIESAWVQGHTIQVRNIERGARLCLSAKTRSVKDVGDGYYVISNGPFMRRFLDGFYPMRLSMELHYPSSLVEVVSVTPEAQEGFTITDKPGLLRYDALFEGELRASIQLAVTRLTLKH